MSYTERRTLRWYVPVLLGLAMFILLALAVLGWMLHGAAAKQSVDDLTGPNPKLQQPRMEYYLPSVHVPRAVGWQGGAQPQAASGLQVNAFAIGLDHPQRMLVLPNGDILVSEASAPHPDEGIGGWFKHLLSGGQSPSPNKILLLRGGAGGNVSQPPITLVTGLNSPSGMTLLGDTLYVADTDALLAYPFHAGDTAIAVRPRRVIALPANAPNEHWARNVIAAEDGKHLYVSIGSNSDHGERGDDANKDRARIVQVDPITGATNVWAGSIRNPAGMSYDPQSKSIWFTGTERSMLGPDLPPDFMSKLDFGTLYGWPWAYWGRRADPRFDNAYDDHHEDFQYYKVPEYALGPHTGATGIAFSNGAKLGAAYAHGAFVALHGSWNRRPLSGYKVIFVPFDDHGRPKGMPLPVLDGFLDANGAAQGRPLDVAIAKDGALLVADDASGRIWRVSAKP